ncbi:MAG: NAD(P)-dependent oxidoreductase [Acidimicrobiia bacterium]|nr:NAD(P)-dependent oxidoreductase [Acidimicrobiia bacterium]
MRLYITGATGFVGRAVVAEALRRGHEVVAVVRPASARSIVDTAPTDAVLTEARVDLRSPDGLTESLRGADSVIHLAAAKSGDFYTQFAGTVVATENLLAAMAEAGVDQLVAISTFSVYDYLAMPTGSLLNEESPLDTDPALRDEYARTKLIQERLYRDFGAVPDHDVTILRPGMIYGPGNLWHALLGADLGPRFLRIGNKAVLPLTYVENCAEAIIDTAEALAARPEDLAGEIINIVDDDLPTQQAYAEQVAARIEIPPTVSIPWPAMNAATTILKKANGWFVGGRAKFPGIAVPDRLHARFKPLRYTNAKAKRLLGWTPRYGLGEALDRSVEAERSTETVPA